MSSRAIGKITPFYLQTVLWIQAALTSLVPFTYGLLDIIKNRAESCLFLRQQYTNYGVKNELIVAEKQKDEQWYLEMKFIKSNNKPTSLLKPGEI